MGNIGNDITFDELKRQYQDAVRMLAELAEEIRQFRENLSLRLVPRNRRGRFRITMGYLEYDENVNKLIFERVTVSMCSINFFDRIVEFEGYSMDFDVVGADEETPMYLFTFMEEGTDPVYISKVERVDL